ncbi:hypothetical protein [Sphingomonas colocasiae]|uniref:Uncharacterized protein n=1 Tax=Sphingomonas colocasiae TaxID=1848973 RepID=A0ABS7PLN2_9SPHN|nr:hypothetical protein [Sphingomonas colocasiae]MBY8822217.1 hypothetical protein [Sphingomonas colocasiae]
MALDAGWAAVIGAGIGAIATLAGTWLTHYLQAKRSSSLAEKRRIRLRSMLSSSKYVWRDIEVLCAAAGADESTTKELLIEIDARASHNKPNVWALVSRAPWPDHQKGSEN